MGAKVQKWGNSLAVRIPAAEAKALGIEEGTDVQVDADVAHQSLAVRVTTPRVCPLADLLKGIPKGTKMREDDWGGAVGNEAW